MLAKGRHWVPMKLSLEQVASIKPRVLSGERQADIAREFGVSKTLIWQYFHDYRM
jgi:hypothetical protein